MLILSARRGLITAAEPIEEYDQRMTPAQAQGLEPLVSAAFLHFVSSHGPYTATLVHLGRDYVPALTAAIDSTSSGREISKRLRLNLTDIAGSRLGTLTLTEGGIGTRLCQLKQWLSADHDSVPTVLKLP
jgi:hypothetical protein